MPTITRLVAAGLVLVACSGRAGREPSSQPPSQVDAPARAPFDAAVVPIAGASELVRPGRVVLLGEMHGTREFPAFVARLAGQALRNVPVIVALELPQEMQPPLDAFVNHPDDARAQALFGTGMWRAPYQDGRTSAAMRELIAQLAGWKQDGARISVVAIDDPARPDDRDAVMAERVLAARAAAPDAFVVALVGNVHNRLVVGVPWDERYRPLGWFLSEAGVDVVSLHGTYAAGSSWSCETPELESCGAAPLESPLEQGEVSVSLATPDPAAAFHGTFHVGQPTASLPAMRHPVRTLFGAPGSARSR